MIRKGIGFFCPDNFTYLSKTAYIDYNGKQLKTAILLNIMNDIIIKFQLNTDDDYDVDDYEFNLYSKILLQRYGKFYKNYIDFLVEKSFIKMKSNYYVKKKARTYVLNWFDERHSVMYIRLCSTCTDSNTRHLTPGVLTVVRILLGK